MAVIIKCKMCGGDLCLNEGSTIATCEYCGTQQTVPSADSDKKLSLFTRANKLRFACEFDKAAGIYESIAAEFPDEAEGYWGLVLCKYGIEYVDDPATGKKIPTCHRSSFDSVMDDGNFEQTLENADAASRKVYREEAKQIEEIRKGIIEVSAKEEPYDIFICYKETAEDGQRTVDSVLAQDIYDALTEKGYRVFFSRITLEDKLGQAYEPYIFAALNSAKVMLCIGTDYEHFNAVWVKNEWSRFLKLMEKDKTKHLIPCYKDIDAYDMPKEFKHLQAQNMGKIGAVQDLLRGIDKLFNSKPAPQQPAGVQGDDVNRIYVYNTALTAMESKRIRSLKIAVENLKELGDWNDAPQQLKKAEAKLKKLKKQRTAKWILIPMLILAVLGSVFLIIDHFANKNTYEQALEEQAEYAYIDAIFTLRRADGYGDSEERIELLQDLIDRRDGAILELVKGSNKENEYNVKFLIDGEDVTLSLRSYVKTHEYLNYNEVRIDRCTYYGLGGFSSTAQEKRLTAFFEPDEPNRMSTLLHYDNETGEYIGYMVMNNGDPGKELFRGTLQSDGSLVVYNAEGETYTLIPQSYEEKVP